MRGDGHGLHRRSGGQPCSAMRWWSLPRHRQLFDGRTNHTGLVSSDSQTCSSMDPTAISTVYFLRTPQPDRGDSSSRRDHTTSGHTVPRVGTYQYSHSRDRHVDAKAVDVSTAFWVRLEDLCVFSDIVNGSGVFSTPTLPLDVATVDQQPRCYFHGCLECLYLGYECSEHHHRPLRVRGELDRRYTLQRPDSVSLLTAGSSRFGCTISGSLPHSPSSLKDKPTVVGSRERRHLHSSIGRCRLEHCLLLRYLAPGTTLGWVGEVLGMSSSRAVDASTVVARLLTLYTDR